MSLITDYLHSILRRYHRIATGLCHGKTTSHQTLFPHIPSHFLMELTGDQLIKCTPLRAGAGNFVVVGRRDFLPLELQLDGSRQLLGWHVTKVKGSAEASSGTWGLTFCILSFESRRKRESPLGAKKDAYASRQPRFVLRSSSAEPNSIEFDVKSGKKILAATLKLLGRTVSGCGYAKIMHTEANISA